MFRLNEMKENINQLIMRMVEIYTHLYIHLCMQKIPHSFDSRSRPYVMSHVTYLPTRPPFLFGGKSSDKLGMKRNQ